MEQDNENNVNFTISKGLLKKGIIFTIVFLVLALFYCISTSVIPKTPEYALYKACTTIKHNEYEESLKYVNIDKIVGTIMEESLQSMYNDPKLKNNPFAGFAYIFAEALKDRIATVIKDSYKELVESSDNVFAEVSEPKLIYFLTIKSYKEMKLSKDNITKNKVVFKFSDNDKYNDLTFGLENNGQNWEIVNMKGYEFWGDKSNR